jgi:hypothetical protein
LGDISNTSKVDLLDVGCRLLQPSAARGAGAASHSA